MKKLIKRLLFGKDITEHKPSIGSPRVKTIHNGADAPYSIQGMKPYTNPFGHENN